MSGYRVVRDRGPATAELWLALGIVIIAGILVWSMITRDDPAFRRACDAEGGVVVRLDSGHACLWAGAFIPIGPTP